MKKTNDAWALGNAIRTLRKQRHQTQEQLARKAGIQPNRLSRIETGEANPPITVVRRIATALGRELPELLKLGEVIATSLGRGGA